MGVQAGAARMMMSKDPHAAGETLARVEESARSALSELRHLLETLRTPGDPAEETSVGLEGLEKLVAEASAAGLASQLRIIGEERDVPDTVQVNLYRIAQEALTNARRHAGPGAQADVRLRYAPEGVELEVANTGRPVAEVAPGMGLIGMRERAAASGGTIEATPRSSGGFVVRVRVPLTPLVAVDAR